jgi:hypothetical protein
MSKKFVISFFVFLILLVVGGFLGWKKYEKFQIRKDLERLTDFYLIESNGQRIIESRNQNFSFIFPEGWRLKRDLKTIEDKSLVDFKDFIGYISMMSPELFEDADSGIETNILKSQRGCFMEIGITKERMTLDEIKKASQDYNIYYKLESDDVYEFIEISGYKAMKNTFDSSTIGHYVGIFVPINDYFYTLILHSSKENQNKCLESFDNLLNTVKIK